MEQPAKLLKLIPCCLRHNYVSGLFKNLRSMKNAFTTKSSLFLMKSYLNINMDFALSRSKKTRISTQLNKAI